MQAKAIRFATTSAIALAAVLAAGQAFAAPCAATTSGALDSVTVNCAPDSGTTLFDTQVFDSSTSTSGPIYDGNGDDVLNLSGDFSNTNTANQPPTVDAPSNRQLNPQTDFILTLGGNDRVNINGATVAGSIFTGDGNDTVTMSAGRIGLGGDQGDSIGLEDGDDSFTMTGGALAGGVSGGDGNDTITVSGGTIGDYIAGNAGNDVVNISGTAFIANQVTTEDGDDRIAISGGTIGTFVDAGPGTDTVSMSGGSVLGYILGGDGNDTIQISGGTVGADAGDGPAGVFGGDGDDTIQISGGTVYGTVDGQGGTDVVTLSGGTIDGDIVAEEVRLYGGTLTGDVSGLTGNTLIINAPNGITLANGVTFSGVNAVATITNTDLAKALNGAFMTQNFAGFNTVGANNSTLGFGGGTQGIGVLSLINGSTLFARGANSIVAPGGGQGNLTVVNSTVNFINGVPNDTLTAGDVVLNNARLAIDVNPTTGASDRIVATRSLTANGTNVVLINSVGGVPQAISIIPISPVAGEAAPTGGTASPFFVATGLPGTPAALYSFDVIGGANGGLYLRSNGLNYAIPLALLPAINAQPVALVLDKVQDIANDTIFTHYALTTGTGNDAAPGFGIYASGQFSETEHNGFDLSSPSFSGKTPGFTSNDFAVAASVEFDAAKYWGFDKDYGLDIGAFGGYTTSRLETDGAFGFDSLGSGNNKSGMFGVYSLIRKSTTYALFSATGFLGHTEINDDAIAATGDYATRGIAVTGTVGHIFALSDTLRFDLRGGLLGANFRGEDFTDSQGNSYGRSKVSFGAVKFEPGFYSQYVLKDGTVLSPYLRTEFQQRFGYANEASFNGTDVDFDDADFSFAGSTGVNYKVNATTTLSSEVRMKLSADSRTFGAKAGLKMRF